MDKTIGDMYLAAAYLSYDVSLQRIDRSNQRRLRFVFADKPCTLITISRDGEVIKEYNQGLDDLETKFVAKTLMFPPSYPESVRRIKATIHAEDDNDRK